MGFISGLFSVIVLIADVWAIISVFQSDASTLKKVLWVILILVLPLVGFILWFLIGPKSHK